MLPIPIGTDRPQRRVPWMNILLIAANLVIYVLSHHFGPAVRGAQQTSSGLTPWWNQGVLNANSPTLFQFISYQFLHASLMHVIGNMVFLYVFGNNLNEKLGHIAYLIFYLAGGILAGCGQLLTENVSTLGASGSISAVTGLFFVLLPRTQIRIYLWTFFYFGMFEIPSVYFILLNVAKDVLEPLIMPGQSVAYVAHITGTVAGVVIGLILLLCKLVQRDHYDLLSLINRWRRRKAYEALVSQGAEFYTHPGGRDSSAAEKLQNQAPTDPRIFDAREVVFAAVRNRRLDEAASAYLALRAMDGTQVLPEDAQLDVANQLMSEGKHSEAAIAYEDYLRVYPRALHGDQVQLMLGLIYARYVPNAEKAVVLLRAASTRLHSAAERELAEAELSRLSAGGVGLPKVEGLGGS